MILLPVNHLCISHSELIITICEGVETVCFTSSFTYTRIHTYANTRAPVSYTHLDVYKRQNVIFPVISNEKYQEIITYLLIYVL